MQKIYKPDDTHLLICRKRNKNWIASSFSWMKIYAKEKRALAKHTKSGESVF